VLAILNACRELKVPIVPRGAGTGLSGGALPLADGVVISTARMNRIVRVEPYARLAVVQPGVRNLAISEAAAAARPVLRARSLVADRLHHRRQRGRKLGRRALPQIRPDRA
jgi:FAD/FMN-containing dehydrogenase